MIQNDRLIIRNMRHDPQDYEMLSRWLTDPEVLQYYEGRDNPFPLSRIMKEYSVLVRSREEIVPCIINYEGTDIGYIQFYPLNARHIEAYDLDSVEQTYGMDLFIGETAYWNKGIGTKVVRTMLVYLFQVLRAQRVIIDPMAENHRAIACYKKAGFKILKTIELHEWHEGELRDACLMEVRREDFQP